jgi:photosystem II stability/assembly factor-like uncharacterized protein
LVTKLQTSSAFSKGDLYRTTDGGQTWKKLATPFGDGVRFLSLTAGWTAGGPGGNELYSTTDGGQTWRKEDMNPPSSLRQVIVFSIGLPTFHDSTHGELPIEFLDSSALQGTSNAAAYMDLYVTSDAGKSWTSTTPIELRPDPGEVTGSKFLALVDPLHWMFAAGGLLRRSVDGGRSWSEVSLPDGSVFDPLPLPSGQQRFSALSDLSFVAEDKGWAVLQIGHCLSPSPGIKEPCPAISMLIVRTLDGGKNWSQP